MQVPGTIEQFQATRTEPGTIKLTWQPPSKGGKVAAYKVQDKNRTLGIWQTVETARPREVVLSHPSYIDVSTEAIVTTGWQV